MAEHSRSFEAPARRPDRRHSFPPHLVILDRLDDIKAIVLSHVHLDHADGLD